MKKFTKQEILELYGQVTLGEISFSEMTEVLNERVSEANEPQYKDGDFVVNMNGSVLISKNKVGDKIYGHAYLTDCKFLIISVSTQAPIERCATEEEKQELLNALAKAGKRWNAEKLCVEDIPARKFKIGDKVRIRHGVSSETHRYVGPNFTEPMDEFIGKELTVKEYSSSGFVVFFGDYLEYNFHEDWLEPYEELKKGDLAIFWDNGGKHRASVRMYGGLFMCDYYDTGGVRWDNAIKFESKEQYERLIKGEI